eukprot:UN07664
MPDTDWCYTDGSVRQGLRVTCVGTTGSHNALGDSIEDVDKNFKTIEAMIESSDINFCKLKQFVNKTP